MTTISIHILNTNGQAAPGKLADAEIHFNGGDLDGLRLVGFAVWKNREGQGEVVTFASRQLPSTASGAASRCCDGWRCARRRAESRTWSGKPTSST